jgi:hypothetical protein
LLNCSRSTDYHGHAAPCKVAHSKHLVISNTASICLICQGALRATFRNCVHTACIPGHRRACCGVAQTEAGSSSARDRASDRATDGQLVASWWKRLGYTCAKLRVHSLSLPLSGLTALLRNLKNDPRVKKPRCWGIDGR